MAGVETALMGFLESAQAVGGSIPGGSTVCASATVLWGGEDTMGQPKVWFSTPVGPESGQNSDDDDSTAGLITEDPVPSASAGLAAALSGPGVTQAASTQPFASTVSAHVLAFSAATATQAFPEVVADYTRRRIAQRTSSGSGACLQPDAGPLRAALAAYVRTLEEDSVIFLAQKLVNCSPEQPSCAVGATGQYCDFECSTCLCDVLRKSQRTAAQAQAPSKSNYKDTLGEDEAPPVEATGAAPDPQPPAPAGHPDSAESTSGHRYHYEEASKGDLVRFDFDEIYQELAGLKDSQADLIPRSTSAGTPVGADGRMEKIYEANEEDAVAPPEVFTRYFWLYRFQSLLRKLSKAKATNQQTLQLQVLTELGGLTWSFCDTAQMYARVIASEAHLNIDDKSIRPADIGGIAGGTKFFAGGILFKFAVDTHGIYGGDDNAAKAALHEIKGVDAVYKCLATDNVAAGLEEIFVPLSCVVTFKGHCIVASSILPIGAETLVYGSSDGGRTCHKDDMAAVTIVESIGRRLNLQVHEVAGIDVAMCGDFEVHRGTDNKLYCLDFARIFPPEPLNSKSAKERDGAPLWFRLMRGELVSQNAEPLVSDVFTPWDMAPEGRRAEHERAALDAYKRLMEVVIPQFGQWLSDKPLVGTDLTGEIHNAGINMRHLLVVMQHVESPMWRRILAAELCYRAHKKVLGGVIRAACRSSGSLPADYDYITLALRYINTIFAGGGRTPEAQSLWVHAANYIARRFTRPTRRPLGDRTGQPEPKSSPHGRITPRQSAFESMCGEMCIMLPGLQACIRDSIHWGYLFKRLGTRSDIRVLPAVIERYETLADFADFKLNDSNIVSSVDVVGMGILTNAMKIAALGRGLQSYYHVVHAGDGAVGNEAIIRALESAITEMLSGGIMDTPYRIEYVMAIMRLGVLLVSKDSPSQNDSMMAVHRWTQAHELIVKWFEEEEAELRRGSRGRSDSYQGGRRSIDTPPKPMMGPVAGIRGSVQMCSREKRKAHWNRVIQEEVLLLQKLMGTMFFMSGFNQERQRVLHRLLMLVTSSAGGMQQQDKFSLVAQTSFSVITGGQSYEPLYDLMPIVPAAVDIWEERALDRAPADEVEGTRALLMQAMCLERWSSYFAGTVLAPGHEDHFVFTSWMEKNFKLAAKMWSFPFHMPFGGSAASYEIKHFRYHNAQKLLAYANSEIDKADKVPPKFIAFNHMIFALTRAGDWSSMRDVKERIERLVKRTGMDRKPRGTGGHFMKVFEMLQAGVAALNGDMSVETLNKVVVELNVIANVYSEIKSLTEFFGLYFIARIRILGGQLAEAASLITHQILPMATDGHRMPIVTDCSAFLGAAHLLSAFESVRDGSPYSAQLAQATNCLAAAQKMEEASATGEAKTRTGLLLEVLDGLRVLYSSELEKMDGSVDMEAGCEARVARMVDAIRVILGDDGVNSTAIGRPLAAAASTLQQQLCDGLIPAEAFTSPGQCQLLGYDRSQLGRPPAQSPRGGRRGSRDDTALSLGKAGGPRLARHVLACEDDPIRLRPTPPPRAEARASPGSHGFDGLSLAERHLGDAELGMPNPSRSLTPEAYLGRHPEGMTPNKLSRSSRLRAEALADRFSTLVKAVVAIL